MITHTPLKTSILGIGTVIAALATASAVVEFDQDVTNNVIFGSGNDNGSFTTDRDNGIELGLRGKLRHNAAGNPENTFNSNGDGTYSFNAGVAPTQSFPTAEWSFEWSINSNFDDNGDFLDQFTYQFKMDSDASQGVDYLTFDPINIALADHSIGTNATTDADDSVAGTDVEYSALISANNLAQNSWKPHWFLSGFDPTEDGTYDFELLAFDETGPVAATKMQIIVGKGGSAVPDGGSMFVMFGGALLGLAGFRRFSQRG